MQCNVSFSKSSKKLSIFKDQKLIKKDHDQQWLKDFRLCCDIVSFVFLLPFIIWSKLLETWSKQCFFCYSWNNANLEVYIRSNWEYFKFFLYIDLRILQMHLNMLPSASNCTNQLNTKSYMAISTQICTIASIRGEWLSGLGI